MVNPEDPDRILIYDNGNERSYGDPVLPENNYSRAVEYRVDEQSMEIEQVWQYGKEPDARHSPRLSEMQITCQTETG
jgi:hypothetical protein